MNRIVSALVLVFVLLVPLGASAQAAPPPAPGAPPAPALPTYAERGDVVRFGEDVVVRAHERVQDVVTMGGDAVIHGVVDGDVVTMGGDVVVFGKVTGDVVTMGGEVDVHGAIDGDAVTAGGDVEFFEGGTVGGRAVTGGGTVGLPDFGRHDRVGAEPKSALQVLLNRMASFGLLFLLGLVLLAAGRERLGAAQAVIVREPVRATLLGLASIVAGLVALIALVVTIIGIPIAVVLVVGAPIAVYAGLATSATVIGAALPIPTLRERPVAQLAAGVGALFVCSFVPIAGGIATALAALLGVGAYARTRLRKTPPLAPPASPAGPYRTAAV